MNKTLPDLPGIYRITCSSNGRYYIGSSTSIRRRYHEHLKRLRNGTHVNIKLLRSFRKYGESNFSCDAVEFTDVGNLIQREQFWLDNSNACSRRYGFNINTVSTGAGPGHMTPAGRKRVSDSAKRRIGPKNSFFGHKHSEETINQMKSKLRGLMSGEKNPFFGKSHSDETKRKLSIALSGRKMPMSFFEKQRGNSRNGKWYLVWSTDGLIYEVNNLSKFCRENGLQRTNAHEAAKTGGRYKGFLFMKSPSR